MPSVMDRLFGRKPRTPDTIGTTLTAARNRLADAQARGANAADRRKAAIASGDRQGAINAEAERVAAGIDAEIAADEVAGLEKGLADAVGAAEAAARAEIEAALVERRRILGERLETDWRRAAAVLAEIIGEVATLARDISEAKAERVVERLPDVDRGLLMHDEAVRIVSTYLADDLSGLPNVPESSNEAAFREHQARKDRDRAEAAEARRVEMEAGRERLRATRGAEGQAEADRVRNPYYGGWRDALSDAAR